VRTHASAVPTITVTAPAVTAAIAAALILDIVASVGFGR
jgi:hypothetical protein